METSENHLPEIEKQFNWKSYFSLLLLSTLFQVNSYAQSVNNINNTLASIKSEQEKQAFDEKMNYIYMAVGLILVIAVAWFSTEFAKKKKTIQVEKKLHRHFIRHPHDPIRRPRIVRSVK